MIKKICIILLICILLSSCSTKNSKIQITNDTTDSSNINSNTTSENKETTKKENSDSDINANNKGNENNNENNTIINDETNQQLLEYNNYINSLSENVRAAFDYISNPCPDSTELILDSEIKRTDIQGMMTYLPTSKRNIQILGSYDKINKIISEPRTEFAEKLYREVVLFNNDKSYTTIVDNQTLLNTNYDNLFGYNRLDDYQKRIYDILSNETITVDKPYYFDSPQSFRKIKIVTSLYKSNNILGTWRNDYRNYFIITNEDNDAIGIELRYGSVENNDEMIKKFETKVSEILRSFPVQYENDYEKIYTIITYMSENISYYMPDNFFANPYEIGEGGYELCSNLDNEYGAIVYGRCECYGFAYTFKYFAEKLGMNCDVIYLSKYIGGVLRENHCENMIKLNGEYYIFEPQVCNWLQLNKNTDAKTLIQQSIQKSTPELISKYTLQFTYSCDELFSDTSNIFSVRCAIVE